MTPPFDSVSESPLETMIASRMGARDRPGRGLIIMIVAAAGTISREIWSTGDDQTQEPAWSLVDHETIYMQYQSTSTFNMDLEYLQQVISSSGMEWNIELWQPRATNIVWNNQITYLRGVIHNWHHISVHLASNSLASLGPSGGWTDDLPSYIYYQAQPLRTVPLLTPWVRKFVSDLVHGFYPAPPGSRSPLDVDDLLGKDIDERAQWAKWIRQDSLLSKWVVARDRLDQRPDKAYVVIQRLWDWPFTGPLTVDTYDRSSTGSNTSPLTQMKAVVARDEIEYIQRTLRSDGRWLRQAADIIQGA